MKLVEEMRKEGALTLPGEPKPKPIKIETQAPIVVDKAKAKKLEEKNAKLQKLKAELGTLVKQKQELMDSVKPIEGVSYAQRLIAKKKELQVAEASLKNLKVGQEKYRHEKQVNDEINECSIQIKSAET